MELNINGQLYPVHNAVNGALMDGETRMKYMVEKEFTPINDPELLIAGVMVISRVEFTPGSSEVHNRILLTCRTSYVRLFERVRIFKKRGHFYIQESIYATYIFWSLLVFVSSHFLKMLTNELFLIIPLVWQTLFTISAWRFHKVYKGHPLYCSENDREFRGA